MVRKAQQFFKAGGGYLTESDTGFRVKGRGGGGGGGGIFMALGERCMILQNANIRTYIYI